MRFYTANQPLFFPLIYMMERFARVDALVVMEEAQFTKFGHQARVQLMGQQGKFHTVLPLQDRAYKRLNEVLVHEPQRWADKMRKQMRTVYGRQPGYRGGMGDGFDLLLEELVASGPLTACCVGAAAIRWLCAVCGLGCSIRRSTALVPERDLDATTWVADLGVSLGADAYLGGEAAMRNYVEEAVFAARGIDLYVQDFAVPPYRQLHGGAFDPMVSALDPLFVGGPELLRALIGAANGPGDTNGSMRPWLAEAA